MTDPSLVLVQTNMLPCSFFHDRLMKMIIPNRQHLLYKKRLKVIFNIIYNTPISFSKLLKSHFLEIDLTVHCSNNCVLVKSVYFHRDFPSCVHLKKAIHKPFVSLKLISCSYFTQIITHFKKNNNNLNHIYNSFL